MRKLKFRAWSEEQKKFIQGYPLGEEQKNGFTVCGISENGEQETTSDGLILMQYTGLNDKNGTEIYELDIVKGEHKDLFVIVPMLGGLSMINIKYYGQKFNELMACPTNEAQCAVWLSGSEVIGNVFENPEIL